MISSKLLLAGLVLAIVSAAALSLQLEWVYSTFFIFLAALFFAYAGGAPEPGSTMSVSHEGARQENEKIARNEHEKHGHAGNEGKHDGHSHGH